MHRAFVLPLLLLNSALLIAQEAGTASQGPGLQRIPVGVLPSTAAKLAEAIQGSYYHPDAMSGLDCAISVDWPAFFKATGTDLSADRVKQIQGLRIHSRALRGTPAEFTLDWSDGKMDTAQQFEGGVKQMMGGFYQIYWQMIASPLVSSFTELRKIEPQPDGSAIVYMSDQDQHLVVTLDKENAPTHLKFDSTAMKGTIDPHYIASPTPIPGDLRRISSLDVTEQAGPTNIQVQLSLDYQSVNGFFVPKHVSFSIVGAYALEMEFSGCSAEKGAIAP